LAKFCRSGMETVSRSDTVRFDVGGKIFEVPVPNLRLMFFSDSVLGQAVLADREGADDCPILVPGDVDLFPFILDMHRQRGMCRIPCTVSKEAMLREARAFGLPASAENIIEEGDVLRDASLLDSKNDSATLLYFKEWTVDHVADWLKHLQQGRFALYSECFRSEGIDGPALVALTQESVRSLGVNDPKTRTALLAAISTEQFVETNKEQSVPNASGEQEEMVEDDRPGNAAVMVLRNMLGESGTSAPFTEMIAAWRAEQPSISDSGAAGAGAATKAVVPVMDKCHNGGIVVAVRVRPVLAEGPDSSALEVGDFETVTVPVVMGDRVVMHMCGMQRDGKTPKLENKSFHIQAALGPTCHEEQIFDLVMPIVDGAVTTASHSTVICFGQTGSGKTHSIGHLAWRIARYLFEQHSARSVVLEAFELKGGAKGIVTQASSVFSLHADSKPELALFEGEDGTAHVGGSDCVVRSDQQPLNLAHCALASSPEELIYFFQDSERRRASSDTLRNAASSRTHAFYRFHLATASQQGTLDEPVVFGTGACIELVDLAGSESNKDCLYHDKVLIDERAKINSSLTALSNCIRKCVEGAAYVPFRADKLTQLLRPCFACNSANARCKSTRVLFLACISPLASDTQQTVRTLTYAQQLAGLQRKPVRTAQQKKFMGPGLKHLAEAVQSGNIDELRAAVAAAQRDGITGPERRRAQQALQALEAAEAAGMQDTDGID